ncbi:unnamed protein product, partial [Rotaria sp. Silwood2]
LSCTMKYTVKDCDPATGEPDNEEVTVSVHVQKVLKLNWSVSWKEISNENELEDRYISSMPTLKDATSSDPGTTAITMQLTICSTDQSVVQVIALAIEETFIYFY